jgi:hypothetical protein
LQAGLVDAELQLRCCCLYRHQHVPLVLLLLSQVRQAIASLQASLVEAEPQLQGCLHNVGLAAPCHRFISPWNNC